MQSLRGAIVIGITLVSLGCVKEPNNARSNFVGMCASCHGTSAKGDGPAAMGFATRPADLTQMAARNGGVFPRIDVIAKIHGYSEGMHDFSAMPGFSGMLDGPTVMIDQGNGKREPTPRPLVELVDYLESIQE